MSYYDLYSYLPFLLSTTTTKSTTNKTKTTINYPTTPYQNANYLSSSSLSIHDKQYQHTTTTARYADKYNCTSANYQQRSIAIQSTAPSIYTQITIKTSNTTANYLNSANFMNNKPNYFNTSNNPANPSANYTNNTPNYFNNNNYNNRPLKEQLQRPEIDESSLSSKSSCTTHSSFQVRTLLL